MAGKKRTKRAKRTVVKPGAKPKGRISKITVLTEIPSAEECAEVEKALKDPAVVADVARLMRASAPAPARATSEDTETILVTVNPGDAPVSVTVNATPGPVRTAIIDGCARIAYHADSSVFGCPTWTEA